MDLPELKTSEFSTTVDLLGCQSYLRSPGDLSSAHPLPTESSAEICSGERIFPPIAQRIQLEKIICLDVLVPSKFSSRRVHELTQSKRGQDCLQPWSSLPKRLEKNLTGNDLAGHKKRGIPAGRVGNCGLGDGRLKENKPGLFRFHQ